MPEKEKGSPVPVFMIVFSTILGLVVLYLLKRLRQLEKNVQHMSKEAEHQIQPHEFDEAVKFFMHNNPQYVGMACMPHVEKIIKTNPHLFYPPVLRGQMNRGALMPQRPVYPPRNPNIMPPAANGYYPQPQTYPMFTPHAHNQPQQPIGSHPFAQFANTSEGNNTVNHPVDDIEDSSESDDEEQDPSFEENHDVQYVQENTKPSVNGVDFFCSYFDKTPNSCFRQNCHGNAVNDRAVEINSNTSTVTDVHETVPDLSFAQNFITVDQVPVYNDKAQNMCLSECDNSSIPHDTFMVANQNSEAQDNREAVLTAQYQQFPENERSLFCMPLAEQSTFNNFERPASNQDSYFFYADGQTNGNSYDSTLSDDHDDNLATGTADYVSDQEDGNELKQIENILESFFPNSRNTPKVRFTLSNRDVFHSKTNSPQQSPQIVEVDDDGDHGNEKDHANNNKLQTTFKIAALDASDANDHQTYDGESDNDSGETVFFDNRKGDNESTLNQEEEEEDIDSQDDPFFCPSDDLGTEHATDVSDDNDT